MWLIDGSPALFTDLYELTMAQVYFEKQMLATAYFEVTVRRLPDNWGFFVMAGLEEVQSYIEQFRFSNHDLEYLQSTALFDSDFIEYLSDFKPAVTIRALPEGTVFFPNEPILEVAGPLLHAQLLETYLLNILGFSIIETTLATRIMIAAQGLPVIDFGLRRSQGPIASIRAARGGQIAGYKATSNVFAAMHLGMPPSGTAAHSFIEVHDSEEQAFHHFVQLYRDKAILPTDTYGNVTGIETASRVAQYFQDQGIHIRGIRLDSGDLVEQSRFARYYFKATGVDFLKIFVSGDLDEFRIAELLQAGASVDGFGVGTRFAVSHRAPAISIVYKIARYNTRDMHKDSPGKKTIPGRKTLLRMGSDVFEKDIVIPFEDRENDMLIPLGATDSISTIKDRLWNSLSAFPNSIQSTRNPTHYPVEFIGFNSK